MKRTANGSYFNVIGRLAISDYKDRIIQASPVDEDGDLFLCEIREEHEPEEKKERKKENRLCEVDGKIGYFQCWEHFSNVVDASPMIGGHPGGTVSNVYAIVEFENGCRRVDPKQLRFCDEKNNMLGCLNRSKNS